MTVHTRRAALAALAPAAAATPLLLATRTALAQTAPARPADANTYSDYVTQTLTIGTVALQTSQLAAEKATDPMVKEFAQLEVGEQTAVATVLSSTGATPPELPADQQAKVQQMQDMAAGPEFDAAYVQAQIEGHQQLLQVQQTISGGMEATVEVITAKLAEQGITSHLAMLNHIQQEMGGAGAATSTQTSSTPPADASATTSTSSDASAATTTTTTEAPATSTTTTAAGDASATTSTAPAGGGASATTSTAPADAGATATTSAAPAGGGAAATSTAQ